MIKILLNYLFLFLDCVTKSYGYTRYPNAGNYHYLFLCEVALNWIKHYDISDKNAKNNLNGYNSVCGRGSYTSNQG